MKKLLVILGLCIAVMSLTSCKSEGQKYMENYVQFAESFLSQYETYTATDWSAAASNYEQYRVAYATYMSDLSVEQRQVIDMYNSKINAAFIRYETQNASIQLESLYNEAIGTLNELLK